MRLLMIGACLLIIGCGKNNIDETEKAFDQPVEIDVLQEGYGVFENSGIKISVHQKIGLSVELSGAKYDPIWADDVLSEKAFFYIKNHNEIWLFNGDDDLSLLHREGTKTTFSNLQSDHDTLTLPIPEKVLNKLPLSLVNSYKRFQSKN